MVMMFTGIFLAGCTTYNPATGRNEFIFISTSEEVTMGKNIHSQISEQYEYSENETAVLRIEAIGQKLARVSDRQDYQYKFNLIEKDEMNAFTTPGGNIYFFTGLLDKLQTDDQIAFVLAHEIGHCAAKHTVKKFQASLGYNLIGSLLAGQLGGGAQQVASLSANALMKVAFSSYGRKDEFESDQLSVKYMRLAGFDLNGAVESLSLLLEHSEGPSAPLILRSHPYIEDRIETVKDTIIDVKARYQ